MKNQHSGLYVIALAIIIVGLVLAGVPTSALLYGLILLAWPVMLSMHDGGQGRDGRTPGQRMARPVRVRVRQDDDTSR